MKPNRRTAFTNSCRLACSALLLVSACTGSGSGGDDLSMGADLGTGGDMTPVPATFILHYHRPLADYAGWSVTTTAGAMEPLATQRDTDGFGAIYVLTVSAGARRGNLQ
jgi:hypothetical protein